MTGTDARTCPDCGRTSQPGQELCSCGFPLMLLAEDAPPQRAVARSPGEQDTPAPPAVVDDEAPTRPLPRVTAPVRRPGELDCPACGEVNGPERTWCVRCGEPLRTPPPPPPSAPPAPVERSAWRRAVLPVLAGVVAVAAVGAAIGLVTAGQDDETAIPPPASGPTAASPVPPDQVTATASNTNPEDGGERYDVRLTLDGRPDTAWNSDGKRHPREGSVLTYTFAEPVHIVRMTVVNGWVRVSPTFGDLFTANHRVAQLTVAGDGGQRTVALEDVREPQDVAVDLGTTSRVTLTVDSTYPGERFADVAVAEVRFWAAQTADGQG